jgi:hypothetical protein
MTRFETTVVVAILAVVGAVHGPAFGQLTIRFDEASGSTVKTAVAEGKGNKGSKAPRAAKPAEPPAPVEPTLKVSGGFEKTKDLARDSAIRAAVSDLHDYLLQQEPPVTRMPTTEFIRRNLLLNEQEQVTTTKVPGDSGTEQDMYKVTVALKVKPEHLRELRSEERSREVLWVLAGLGGLAAVGAVFFRIDAWTKGYLTSWLVLGTVGAATLLTGLWWWAK